MCIGTKEKQNTSPHEKKRCRSTILALIGLAVMGQNLVLNMANHGFSVGVFNRTTATTVEFVGSLNDQPDGVVAEGTPDRISGYHTLEELVQNLKSPKKVMLMVKAGPAVDSFIERLSAAPQPRGHHHRRRQHDVRRHEPPNQRSGRVRVAFYRHRCFRRRGWGAEGAEHYARRFT